MGIKVKFVEGVFKPMESIKGIDEGEELEVHIENDDLHALAIAGEAFYFLKDEPELYSKKDLIKRYK